MWENIVVILLIILFSYLFRQSGTNMGANNKKINTFDTQMLFILLSLGALIFYKMTYIKKMEKGMEKGMNNEKEKQSFQNTENFSDLGDIIKNFSNNTSSGTESKSEPPLDSNLIRDELQNLRNIINNMSEKKDENINLDGQEINKENLVAFQNLQLNNLENAITEIKNNNQDAENINVNKTFKKIPVYNSCYVINADNSVSENTDNEQVDENTTEVDINNNNNDNSNNTSNQQSTIINQSSGNTVSSSQREKNIKNMTERLEKLENFFETLMKKFTNIKLLV